MKIFFFSLIFLFTFNFSFAQYELVSSFNSVHIGRNVSFGVKKSVSNYSFSFAAKYGINSLISSDQNEVFKKSFYAKSFVEHLGLNINFHYYIPFKKLFIVPFVFYNFQVTRSHTRNHGFLKYGIEQVTGIVMYKEYLEFWGPTTALENYIGVGYKVDINKYMYVNNKIGYGIISYFNVDKMLYGDGGNWELGYMINIEIGYKIKSP